MLKEGRKKTFIALSIFCLVIVTSCLVYYFYLSNLGDKNKKDIKYTTEFIFKEEETTIEIKVDKETGMTWKFVDGKRDKMLTSIPRNPPSVLELPVTAKSTNILEDREPVSDLTWESTLEESTQYLNFLKHEGYSVTRAVSTSNYIEMILTKESSRKRLIVFKTNLMEGELDQDAKLPSVKEYLKKYEYLGGNKDE